MAIPKVWLSTGRMALSRYEEHQPSITRCGGEGYVELIPITRLAPFPSPTLGRVSAKTPDEGVRVSLKSSARGAFVEGAVLRVRSDETA